MDDTITTTDEYLQVLPEWQRANLRSFRTIVHDECPAITEAIKWGVPVFMYKSKMLFSMAAFKEHT